MKHTSVKIGKHSVLVDSENLDFSTALHLLKVGKHVQRKGWNGKGLEIIYREGYPDGIPCNESTAKDYGLNVGDLFYCQPYFQIHCKATNTVNTWVPSVSDLLAEDWQVVEKQENIRRTNNEKNTSNYFDNSSNMLFNNKL